MTRKTRVWARIAVAAFLFAFGWMGVVSFRESSDWMNANELRREAMMRTFGLLVDVGAVVVFAVLACIVLFRPLKEDPIEDAEPLVRRAPRGDRV